MIEAGETAEAIKAAWQHDIAAFRVQRKPCLCTTNSEKAIGQRTSELQGNYGRYI